MNHNLPTHWTTKDKSVIAICDMSDAHIINSINVLNRSIGRTMEAYDACYGHGFVGEMSTYYTEIEASRCEDHISKMRLVQKALKFEQKKRQELLKTRQ